MLIIKFRSAFLFSCLAAALVADASAVATEAMAHPYAGEGARARSTWAPLRISEAPSTEEICRTHFFDYPLMPSRLPTAQENTELLQALQILARRTVRDDFSSLTAFLELYPASPWALAIETQLGREFCLTGHFSKSLAAFEHAWGSSKPTSGGPTTSLANSAGSELAQMYARLGHSGRLRALLTELHELPEPQHSSAMLRHARESLWAMEQQPEHTFRCGPMSLHRLFVNTERTEGSDNLIAKSRATTNGCSAQQVVELANQLGMRYQVAFRKQGAPVLLPAIVHWKVGHFSAVIARDGDLVCSDDPTFGTKTWVSNEALDDEASGYYLVRSGPLPAGWRTVSPEEAGHVWGKGKTDQGFKLATNSFDQQTQNQCNKNAMAFWNIHLSLVSNHVEDTPVGYTPPVGPPIYFTVSYDSESATLPDTVPFSNVAPDWRINWLAWITDDPMNPAGDVQAAVDGGGTMVFTDFNSTNQVFQNLFYNRASLVRTGTNSYELSSPDGSKKVFDLPGGQIGTARQIYMTAVVDPAGNAATIQFESPGKITTITDAIGQQTKLYYEFAYTAYWLVPDPPYSIPFPGTNYYLLTRVVDPFGRTATFQVNSPTNFYPIPNQEIISARYAQLTNIVDEIGLTSAFTYSGPWLQTLTTAYGQTRFDPGSFNGLWRANWIEVTHPNGEKERVEYSENPRANIPTEEPLSIVPKGVPVRNLYLFARNTYHWDRKAYAEGYAPDDYSKARIYHWTHALDYNTSSPILESYKAPLEHRVWFTHDGQMSPTFAGTSDRPTSVARVLEDGTTQLYQFAYNPLGNVTGTIDAVGRTFKLVYDTNDVDLLEVRQARAGRNELLFKATYNSQHLPLTIAEADLQTYRFSYNQRGQVLTAADPQGNVTTFSYDNNGYLIALDGPLPGTNDTTHFTYDGLGRLQTATDLDGYTLTFDYDNLDRPTRINYPDGSFEQVTYNRLDPAVLRDRGGRETILTYDSLRQLVAIQDALGRVTRYQWCGCGGLESVIDPLGRATSWIRDLQGRLTAKVFADGSQVNYEYDPSSGWLKRRRDEQNQITQYDHNADGTLSQRSYLNASVPIANVQFTYDPNYPRPVTMQDGTGLTTFAYHPILETPSPGAGALALIDGPLANDTIAYGYDGLGRLSQRSINGHGLERTWDPDDRMQRLTNSLGTFTFEWQGDSHRIAAVNYPNGQRSTYSYHPNLKDQLLSQITHLKPDGTQLSRFTYDYNTVRQITDWTQERVGANPVNYHFDYDTINRLTNAVGTQNGSTSSYSYSYDASENLTFANENGNVGTYSFNALNEPVFGTNDTLSARAYQWDAEHQLAAINEGTHRTEFGYDGFGRRTRIVEKENDSVVSDRRYVWSGTDLSEERDETGTNVLNRFDVFGVQAAPQSHLPVGNYFYARDHLFSVRAMTDSSGQPRALYDYTPYGARLRLAGDLDSDFGFSGFYFHSPSSLNLSLYRTYESRLARWLSRDPLEEDPGFSQYSYAWNDPINNWDPFGLQAQVIIFGTDSRNAARARQLNPSPGELVVAMHGNEDGPAVLKGKNWKHEDFEDLAKEIQSVLDTSGETYTTIRLLSCQTAKSDIPQRLANRFHMKVLAPNAFVQLSDKGKFSLYEDQKLKHRLRDQESGWEPFEFKSIDRPPAPDVSIHK